MKKIKNEQKLLEFIKVFSKENGYPPTVREMCKALNVSSTSTISYYLSKLKEDGLIKKEPNKNRALEVINTTVEDFNLSNNVSGIEKIDTSNLVAIPVIGKITAGEPVLAVENCEEYFMVSPNMFRGDDLFMLTVSGESMINAGIYNGDKVVVRQQSYAHNGEIVAALIDGCATVKRFYKEDGGYRLQPENDTMKPIYTKECEIIGKIVGLVRKF